MVQTPLPHERCGATGQRSFDHFASFDGDERIVALLGDVHMQCVPWSAKYMRTTIPKKVEMIGTTYIFRRYSPPTA